MVFTVPFWLRICPPRNFIGGHLGDGRARGIISTSQCVAGIVPFVPRVPRKNNREPKTGTVTFEVATAIQEIKAGKVEFKVDKAGSMHGPVGRISFDEAKLIENAQAFIGAINKAKPSAAKGKYFQSLTITTTMGPAVRLDAEALVVEFGRMS